MQVSFTIYLEEHPELTCNDEIECVYNYWGEYRPQTWDSPAEYPEVEFSAAFIRNGNFIDREICFDHILKEWKEEVLEEMAFEAAKDMIDDIEIEKYIFDKGY